MKVYNKSKETIEKAKIVNCPRCNGFGANHPEEKCSLCDGYCTVWISKSGWYRAKYANIADSRLY